MDDAGEYQVVAVNDVGACSSKAILTVYPKSNDKYDEEPPRFLSGLRDVNADEGQTIEIGAPFVANPIPEIIWSKDGSMYWSVYIVDHVFYSYCC